VLELSDLRTHPQLPLIEPPLWGKFVELDVAGLEPNFAADIQEILEYLFFDIFEALPVKVDRDVEHEMVLLVEYLFARSRVVVEISEKELGLEGEQVLERGMDAQ